MYLNVLMHSQQMLKYQTSLNKKCVFSLLTLGLCDSDIISDKSVTHVLWKYFNRRYALDVDEHVRRSSHLLPAASGANYLTYRRSYLIKYQRIPVDTSILLLLDTS